MDDLAASGATIALAASGLCIILLLVGLAAFGWKTVHTRSRTVEPQTAQEKRPQMTDANMVDTLMMANKGPVRAKRPGLLTLVGGLVGGSLGCALSFLTSQWFLAMANAPDVDDQLVVYLGISGLLILPLLVTLGTATGGMMVLRLNSGRGLPRRALIRPLRGTGIGAGIGLLVGIGLMLLVWSTGPMPGSAYLGTLFLPPIVASFGALVGLVGVSRWLAKQDIRPNAEPDEDT